MIACFPSAQKQGRLARRAATKSFRKNCRGNNSTLFQVHNFRKTAKKNLRDSHVRNRLTRANMISRQGRSNSRLHIAMDYRQHASYCPRLECYGLEIQQQRSNSSVSQNARTQKNAANGRRARPLCKIAADRPTTLLSTATHNSHQCSKKL